MARSKIYYYRIIIAAQPGLDDYLIDKYTIDGQELWKGLGEKLEIFLNSFPGARKTSSGQPNSFTLSSTRAYSIELDMNIVGTSISSSLDNIDVFIRQTINSIAKTTNTDIPNPPIFETKRSSGSNFTPSNDPFTEYGGSSEFTISFKSKDKKADESKETFSHTIQIIVDAGAPLIDYEVGEEGILDYLLTQLEDYMNNSPKKATIINPFEMIEATRKRFFVRCFFNTPLRETLNEEIKALDDIVFNTLNTESDSFQKQGLVKLDTKTLDDTNIYGKGKADQYIITIKKGDKTETDQYVPDTTPFRKRGLVKIQGEEEYRAAGQILAKDLLSDPNKVASDNQTHLNGSETDEQLENSIDVALWYFKNKTTGNLDTFEIRSGFQRSVYVNEYNRISQLIK